MTQHTAAALAARRVAPLVVGFSGGGDSSALLHVLAGLTEARRRGLRAIHVDHGIHPDSMRWAEHCRAFCATLQVPIEVHRTHVADERGEGLEAAARRARHAEFARSLGDGEILLLAHHRDDQVETVLLKLLRGAGPAGLAGMRAERAFGRGTLWRPWLDVPRETIRACLAERGLAGLDDPANADPQHARNRLRHQLLPLLHRHWPQASASILHSATLCRAAAEHLDIAADAALSRLLDHDRLDAAGWLALDDAVRPIALERWLHCRGLTAPDTAQRREVERQAADSAPDRTPCIAWPGTELRIWRGHLHAMRPLPARPDDWRAIWCGESVPLPLGRLETGDGRRTPDGIEVRLPTPGQRLRPAHDTHVRGLAELLRQHGAPPWLRPYWPLLFRRDELIAVPGLCVTDAGTDCFAGPGELPTWRRD